MPDALLLTGISRGYAWGMRKRALKSLRAVN